MVQSQGVRRQSSAGQAVHQVRSLVEETLELDASGSDERFEAVRRAGVSDGVCRLTGVLDEKEIVLRADLAEVPGAPASMPSASSRIWPRWKVEPTRWNPKRDPRRRPGFFASS